MKFSVPRLKVLVAVDSVNTFYVPWNQLNALKNIEKKKARERRAQSRDCKISHSILYSLVVKLLVYGLTQIVVGTWYQNDRGGGGGGGDGGHDKI